MRPLSEVPISTPPRAATREKPVIEVELQTTSELPSARIWNTALRAFERSLRLRTGCGVCGWATPPVSSTAVIAVIVVTTADASAGGAAAPGVTLRLIEADSLSPRA